jgi:hypothetical protein
MHAVHDMWWFVNHMIKREGSFPAKEVVNLVLARRIGIIIITNASPRSEFAHRGARQAQRPSEWRAAAQPKLIADSHPPQSLRSFVSLGPIKEKSFGMRRPLVSVASQRRLLQLKANFAAADLWRKKIFVTRRPRFLLSDFGVGA